MIAGRGFSGRRWYEPGVTLVRALLVATTLLFALPAAAAERVTVAVLYFDNNSPDRAYDVLQKGLADMLVTDLSQVESLQVVERDKLQKLVDELKLQRSKFFDPRTAQQLGKGIGARYAVTGALAAFEPRMRIDVRVIEVATARVVVADRVVGDRGKFFELESELVGKLAAALKVKLTTSRGSGDVATVLAYAQGLDAADRGDLKGASSRLAEVVRNAPDFQLARDRYAEIMRRLRLASQRREGALSSAEADLVKSIDAHLAVPIAGLDRDALALRLGYRVARGNYLLFKLAALVSPHRSFHGPAIAAAEQRAEVRQRSQGYFENTRLLMDELRATSNAGASSPRIEPEDVKRAEAAGWKGIDSWSFLGTAPAALALARFTVQGEAPFWSSVSLSVRPSLTDLDRAYGARALTLVTEAEKELGARAKPEPDRMVEAIDAHAEVLVALGRKEEAIAQWQRVLDGYPTHARYKEVEKKVEDLLGVSAEAGQFSAALKGCTNDLWTLVPGAMARARRASGLHGVRKQIDQIAAACQGTVMTAGFMASAWQYGVQEALKAGDCDLYREIKGQAAKAGGNVLDGIVRTAGNACGETLPEMSR
jgi:TolB-like protein